MKSGVTIGLFSNVFKLFSSELSADDSEIIQEVIKSSLSVFELDKNHFITCSEADNIISIWSSNVKKIKNIHIPKKDPLSKAVQDYLIQYDHINSEIAQHNQNFMDNECIRCKDLLSNIDGKTLDHQQQSVVVCDENRCLVLAGAGSGKTLTIATKVKYLHREKKIDPKDILLISFTRKVVNEMTKRKHPGSAPVPEEPTLPHICMNLFSRSVLQRLDSLKSEIRVCHTAHSPSYPDIFLFNFQSA